MTQAKIQHYVPKFLLRNFGTGKKDQLWVYDKQTGSTFPTNVKNIASESRFYDFKVDGEDHSIESSLSSIEAKTKPVIEHILRNDSVSGLTRTERSVLSTFLSIQFVRTRAFREQWKDLQRLMREKIESMGDKVAPGSQAEALMQPQSENEIKLDSARIVVKAPEDFGPHFMNKIWFLAKTTKSRPFFIGDNPVSLQNHVDMEPYGNLGLGVRGIEVYLPLSSTRALAMYCPWLAKEITDAAATIRSSPSELVKATMRNPEMVLALASALQNGTTFPYEPDHVTNFNSLQVGRSERYVCSSVNDFELVRKMIGDHPIFKAGPRLYDMAAGRQ